MRKLIILLLGMLLSSQTLPSSNPELDCLTKTVYHEARGEPHRGKLAVAVTILNRVAHPRYPKTICKVVYQRGQFSWVGKKQLRVNQKEWEEAINIALTVLDNPLILGEFKAISFHSLKVKPQWKLKRVAKIGNHIFYK